MMWTIRKITTPMERVVAGYARGEAMITDTWWDRGVRRLKRRLRSLWRRTNELL